MKVRDLCLIIDELAPPALAYPWDKAGLHTGDPDADVTRVLVVLTVAPETVAAAKRRKAQMIVAHHPLIWDPLVSLRRDAPHAALCLALAEADIACYSAHTNLDVAPGGVSHCLGETLGLQEMRPLLRVEQASQVKLVTFVPPQHVDALRAAVCEAGAGTIGGYTHCTFSTSGIGTFRPSEASRPFSGRKGRLNEEPELRFETVVPAWRLPHVLEALFRVHPYEEPACDIVPLENGIPGIGLGMRGTLPSGLPLGEFASHVVARLDCGHARVIGDAKRKVKQVAVIGGSGGGELHRVPPDVEAVVTGDVKYHEGLEAQHRGLAVIDAGHEATERPVIPMLAQHLRTRATGVRVYEYLEPPLFEVRTK